jgi:pyridoxal phosphate enzyme (YggS family)
MATVAQNLKIIQEKMRAACARSGRPLECVTLVAVSKFQASERIEEAAAAGLRFFAESREQEAGTKLPRLKGLGEWHFIGRLQTNKARSVAESFDVVQSVDSLRLAQKLSDAALGLGKTLRIYAQVNISGEPQKQGFSLLESEAELLGLKAFDHLKLEGLMGMAAQEGSSEAVRLSFRGLKSLRQRLEPQLGPLKLSMGMSGDFETAIEEGADLIRVGTALFQ